jgi:excisionase family DNA binding protein
MESLTTTDQLQHLITMVEDIHTRLNDTPHDGGLQSFRLYTYKQVAEYLGLKDPKGVYLISERELPRHRVGPSRGAIRFHGIQVMRYVQGLPPLDLSKEMAVEIPVSPEKKRLV